MTTDVDWSLAAFEVADLLRLAAPAAEAGAELFERRPRGSGRYADRLLCRALSKVLPVHYANGKKGVRVFDVWSFSPGMCPVTGISARANASAWFAEPMAYSALLVAFLVLPAVSAERSLGDPAGEPDLHR
ncbi:MAG TPA: hypothetical protein VMA73_33315, partial [Streptosporangiaceae bacterium]|nr:hypothetical protein [Streptosporangiaceae bacterium]